MSDYASVKFQEAVSSLAASNASLKTRLGYAALTLGPIVSPRNFPNADLAAKYDALHDRMTAVKDGPASEGQFANTIAAMSDQEAVEVADLIVDLAFDLSKHQT